MGCLRHVCAEVKSWDTVVLTFQNDAAPSTFDPLLSAFFNIFFLSPLFLLASVITVSSSCRLSVSLRTVLIIKTLNIFFLFVAVCFVAMNFFQVLVGLMRTFRDAQTIITTVATKSGTYGNIILCYVRHWSKCKILHLAWLFGNAAICS